MSKPIKSAVRWLVTFADDKGELGTLPALARSALAYVTGLRPDVTEIPATLAEHQALIKLLAKVPESCGARAACLLKASVDSVASGTPELHFQAMREIDRVLPALVDSVMGAEPAVFVGSDPEPVEKADTAPAVAPATWGADATKAVDSSELAG